MGWRDVVNYVALFVEAVCRGCNHLVWGVPPTQDGWSPQTYSLTEKLTVELRYYLACISLLLSMK